LYGSQSNDNYTPESKRQNNPFDPRKRLEGTEMTTEEEKAAGRYFIKRCRDSSRTRQPKHPREEQEDSMSGNARQKFCQSQKR
jgi:hypothetical protein